MCAPAKFRTLQIASLRYLSFVPEVTETKIFENVEVEIPTNEFCLVFDNNIIECEVSTSQFCLEYIDETTELENGSNVNDLEVCE